MSDARPFSPEAPELDLQDWQLVARINQAYASLHGYGFVYMQVGANGSGGLEDLAKMVGLNIKRWNDPKLRLACEHPEYGGRVSPWCKLPAVAQVMLHGVRGRHCSKLLYLDSDAFVVNVTQSTDGYLAHKRDIGDEALQLESPWSLLIPNNWPWDPDSVNTAVLFVANTLDSCGILRRWWDAPGSNVHPFEQASLETFYLNQRAFGERVRMMPTAQFMSLPTANDPSFADFLRGPFPDQNHDFFIYHGFKMKYHWYRLSVLTEALANAKARLSELGLTVGATPAEVRPVLYDFATRLFESVDATAGCPLARVRPGVADLPAHVELRQSATNLNGTPSQTPRRCWKAYKTPNYVKKVLPGTQTCADIGQVCEIWAC